MNRITVFGVPHLTSFFHTSSLPPSPSPSLSPSYRKDSRSSKTTLEDVRKTMISMSNIEPALQAFIDVETDTISNYPVYMESTFSYKD